jgi:hypothetical protein
MVCFQAMKLQRIISASCHLPPVVAYNIQKEGGRPQPATTDHKLTAAAGRFLHRIWYYEIPVVYSRGDVRNGNSLLFDFQIEVIPFY